MAPPRAAISTMLRRSYAASARAAEAQQQRAPGMAAMISAAEGSAGGPASSGTEASWMRDPKTGYWLPENRFSADVDADELRAQLLSRKR